MTIQQQFDQEQSEKRVVSAKTEISLSPGRRRLIQGVGVAKLVPRALWWFRWGAMFTLITGLGIFALRGGGMSMDIYVSALLRIIMFLNVWLIIGPNQKIVIASATQVANGGDALPEAAGPLTTAGLASRTNAVFSIFQCCFSWELHPIIHTALNCWRLSLLLL